MLYCPGCQDWLITRETLPLCKICYDSITLTRPLNIQLTERIHATSLFQLTETNYSIFKAWKTHSGRAWDRLISKQLIYTKLSVDFIIPIPQKFEHSWKMKGGSSNCFSEIISVASSIPIRNALCYLDGLGQKKATLGLLDRMTSPNSFAVNSTVEIKNTKVLLTDDFLTSGKTILDAIERLDQAGVGSVSVLVLASEKASPSTNSAA